MSPPPAAPPRTCPAQQEGGGRVLAALRIVLVRPDGGPARATGHGWHGRLGAASATIMHVARPARPVIAA